MKSDLSEAVTHVLSDVSTVSIFQKTVLKDVLMKLDHNSQDVYVEMELMKSTVTQYVTNVISDVEHVMNIHVGNVMLTEKTLVEVAHVLPDSMKMVMNVSDVLPNALPVKSLLKTVLLVLPKETPPQAVTVMLVTITTLYMMTVKCVTIGVKLVPNPVITVPSVKVTEVQHQSVHVLMDMFKVIINYHSTYVHYVLTNVSLVTNLKTCVLNVLKIESIFLFAHAH